MTDKLIEKAITTGSVSNKNPITQFKRALNKHSRTALNTLIATMESTKDEKLKASIATSLLKMYADMMELESTERMKTKEFYLKHKDELLQLARDGVTMNDNDDEDDDSPLLDFNTISKET